MRVRVEPVGLQQDGRGSVFEPLEPDGLPRQRHVHVVVTEPGRVRGNHDHVHAMEVVTVQGQTASTHRLLWCGVKSARGRAVTLRMCTLVL
jgi:hypothetical protein